MKFKTVLITCLSFITLYSNAQEVQKAEEVQEAHETEEVQKAENVQEAHETKEVQNIDNLYRYREMVLNYSHDLKSAQYKTNIKIEEKKSAKANFLPSLSGNADFNYTGNPLELNLNLLQTANSEQGYPLHFAGQNSKYGANLTLAQPIYSGGAIRAGYELAEKELELANYEHNLISDNILYNADVYYWNKVARAEIIGVKEDYLNSITELVDVIEDRVEEGLTDKSDLLMAEVKLNNAKYQLLEAENEAEKARLALNSFAGIPFNSQICTDSIVTPLTNNYRAACDIDQIAANRPEFKIASNMVTAQESVSKIANSRYLPKVSIGVNGNYTAPGYDFKSDMDPNYVVYAKLSVPIFNWGKRHNTYKAGQYNVNMMEENRDKVNDNIHLEVNTALYNYSQAIEKIELTNNSLEKAKANEEIAMEKYCEGNNSIVEVINAQLYYQEARIHYILSKLNAQITKSNLDRVTGVINN